jgi:hypothetical protein
MKYDMSEQMFAKKIYALFQEKYANIFILNFHPCQRSFLSPPPRNRTQTEPKNTKEGISRSLSANVYSSAACTTVKIK